MQIADANGSASAATRPRRRVRAFFFNPWAAHVEDAAEYLARLPGLDLGPLVANPADPALMAKARLDCDWHGECARCFAAMAEPGLEFLPARVVGTSGLADFAGACPRRPHDEEWWLIFMGQTPQRLEAAAGRLSGFVRQFGVRVLLYAFDEASRRMPCFRAVAPHLEVLIHDEAPLDPAGAAALRPDCVDLHRSWVANFVPFSVPFNEAPEEKVLFLGSQLGLTPHRQRQLDFLRKRFKDRLVAHHDHSVSVAARGALNRFKVGFCPEGRMFASPAMSAAHTDRPFWSGCLGLVPVSEDSRAGGRLEPHHQAALIVRYPHGDLAALAGACERALALSLAERRRIYEHFNRRETVGTVVAEAIAAAGSGTPSR
jgi:hypothetical protein